MRSGRDAAEHTLQQLARAAAYVAPTGEGRRAARSLEQRGRARRRRNPRRLRSNLLTLASLLVILVTLPLSLFWVVKVVQVTLFC